MGHKGQGKGKSVKKIESPNTSDDENFEECPEEEDLNLSIIATPIQKLAVSRKRGRKARKPTSDDEDDDDSNYVPTPKKIKREPRPAIKAVSSDFSNSESFINRLSGVMSPPNQHTEPAPNHYGAHSLDIYGNDDMFGPRARPLPPIVPDPYQNYDFNGYQPGHSTHSSFGQSSIGHSLGTDQDFSNALNSADQFSNAEFDAQFEQPLDD